MRRTIELRTVFVVVFAIACGGLTSRILSAAQPTASSDVLTALLGEVKGLRMAIEQISSASGRIQLSVARLQIEEQRVTDGSRRLQTLRQRLTDARRLLQNNEEHVARIEDELQSGKVGDQEREQFNSQLTVVKREGVPLRTTVSELSAEEAQLSQDVAAEQARWIEISRRLDELDASMARK